jgi:Asp-tRNA(Asn)/Glu-tRNA(Gln) amidotransferase C subunit
MALQSPTAQHLRRLAEAHHFELNENELAAFQSLLPGIFTALDGLDQLRTKDRKRPDKSRHSLTRERVDEDYQKGCYAY